MRAVGPVKLAGPEVEGEFLLPLATYEKPLWPSVLRGARVSAAIGGLRAVVIDERMTRSILLEAPNAAAALAVVGALPGRRAELEAAASASSRFTRLLDWHSQIVGNLLFLRFAFATGDAAGHNMATAAAERLQDFLLRAYPTLAYVSISGNYCTDKKPAAVNGILGRGRSVVVEGVLPAACCTRLLKTTPAAMATLNQRKNLLGSLVAGGLRSANAHFANMVLAFYLATGQDAANVVEGSQGFTSAEVQGDALYFAVSVPHLIVGTVGSGKDLAFVRDNLAALGCLEPRPPGANARRLAVLCAAAVWCGELSLLAAQTNRGELMRAHRALERA